VLQWTMHSVVQFDFILTLFLLHLLLWILINWKSKFKFLAKPETYMFTQKHCFWWQCLKMSRIIRSPQVLVATMKSKSPQHLHSNQPWQPWRVPGQTPHGASRWQVWRLPNLEDTFWRPKRIDLWKKQSEMFVFEIRIAEEKDKPKTAIKMCSKLTFFTRRSMLRCCNQPKSHL